MPNWRAFDKRLCISCLYAVAVSLAIAVTGDWLMALFVFSTTSVLIAGWRSGDQALFSLALLIFMGWVINTVVYFAFQRFEAVTVAGVSIFGTTVIYFVAAAVHWIVAIYAFNSDQASVASLGAFMGTIAVVGMVSGDVMPWRAVGNVAFLLQCGFFIGVCLLVSRRKREQPAAKSSGQVLKFEAGHGRSIAGLR